MIRVNNQQDGRALNPHDWPSSLRSNQDSSVPSDQARAATPVRTGGDNAAQPTADYDSLRHEQSRYHIDLYAAYRRASIHSSSQATSAPPAAQDSPSVGGNRVHSAAARLPPTDARTTTTLASPDVEGAANRHGQAASEVRRSFQERFSAAAADGRRFHELMRDVYGRNYDAGAAEGFRRRAIGGDYGWLPEVEFKDDRALRGGNGAFDASRSKVYLNERFLHDPGRAAAVYSEEVGHFLDGRLNRNDTVGDEGEMFRRLLSGERLTDAQRAVIRSDQDQGVITIDGRRTEVEYSIFDDIWDGAKKVGGAIVDGAKKVGEAVVDGAEWVADKASDAAEWIGPRILDAGEGLFTGAVNTVVGAARNTWEGITTFGSGFGKLFQGDVGGAFESWGMGLVKTFVQTPVDAFLMAGGRAISAVQTLVGLEPPGRRLTDAEIAELRKVYGDSIDYSRVKVKEGSAGLFSVTGRAFTHGDTIYIPEGDLPLQTDLLAHEMGHVWQHQNGGTDYMSEALWAQNFGDGYDFEQGIREGKSWGELNPEQQAELIQTAHRSGFFDDPGGRFIHNGTDYTDYLNDALRQIRRGEGAP